MMKRTRHYLRIPIVSALLLVCILKISIDETAYAEAPETAVSFSTVSTADDISTGCTSDQRTFVRFLQHSYESTHIWGTELTLVKEAGCVEP